VARSARVSYSASQRRYGRTGRLGAGNQRRHWLRSMPEPLALRSVTHPSKAQSLPSPPAVHLVDPGSVVGLAGSFSRAARSAIVAYPHCHARRGASPSGRPTNRNNTLLREFHGRIIRPYGVAGRSAGTPFRRVVVAYVGVIWAAPGRSTSITRLARGPAMLCRRPTGPVC